LISLDKVRLDLHKEEIFFVVTFGNLFFHLSFTMIKYKKQIIVCIIEYSACHSYVSMESDHGVLKIASLDTLISLYFSLGLLHTRLFNIGSMECMAVKLVEISMKSRKQHDSFVFPFVSVRCSGHQSSLPSLIRAKVNRITKKKNVINRTFRKRR
jgi:hypothetical protein